MFLSLQSQLADLHGCLLVIVGGRPAAPIKQVAVCRPVWVYEQGCIIRTRCWTGNMAALQATNRDTAAKNNNDKKNNLTPYVYFVLSAFCWQKHSQKQAAIIARHKS